MAVSFGPGKSTHSLQPLAQGHPQVIPIFQSP